MAITFYYGSGSPFAWKVWLVLEHKQLSYQLKLMSLQSGELKKPEYLAINPRGKVPTLIDDGYTLWESSVIVEYLEERYPEHSVLPRNPEDRALARRVAAEADQYLYPVLRRLMEQTLFRPDGNGDAARDTKTMPMVTSVSATTVTAMTGLGPYRLSARPPNQANSAPVIVPRMPNSPRSTADHPSTPAA